MFILASKEGLTLALDRIEYRAGDKEGAPRRPNVDEGWIFESKSRSSPRLKTQTSTGTR